MSNKRLFLILLTFFIFLISLTAASAADINGTDGDEVISMADEESVISQDTGDEILSDASSEYTRNDLKCEFKETGYYYGETKLHLKLTNTTSKKGIANKDVEIYVNNKLMKKFTTDSDGGINTNFKKLPGKYSLEAKLKDSGLTIGTLDVTISKIPTSFNLAQKSAYYKDAKLNIKLSNILNGKAMAGEKITLKFSNGKTVTLKTNSKGIAAYNIPFKPGTYTVTASTVSKYVKKNTVTLKNFPIGKTYLKIDSKSLSVPYKSGKTLSVKVTNYFTKHAMKNVKLTLKIFTGKKSKTVTVKTNSKGVAKYDVSQLNAGSHKITIKTAEKYTECSAKTVTAKISK